MPMGRYFLRRLFYSLLTILLIATVTFFMMHAIPGGPFTREKAIPDEILRVIEAKYNLDAPLWQQYLDYIKGLITFDLGPSFQKVGTSVNDLIISGFPNTLKIGFFAILAIIIVGVPVGIISALKQNKPIDYTYEKQKSRTIVS
jgi:oligopeptide transport system permease protein